MQNPDKLETGELQQFRDRPFTQPALLQWLALMPDQDAESKAQAVILAAIKTHAQAVLIQKIAEVAAATLRDGEEALFFRAIELCGPQLLTQPAVRDELVGRLPPSPRERKKVQAFFRELGCKLPVDPQTGALPRTTAEEKGARRPQPLPGVHRGRRNGAVLKAKGRTLSAKFR